MYFGGRFAGLGAGLAWGTLQESTKRLIYGTPPTSPGNQSAVSPFLSPQNAERLALALCRMRGAALKLGQMLSIQDESLVPAPVTILIHILFFVHWLLACVSSACKCVRWRVDIGSSRYCPSRCRCDATGPAQSGFGC